MTPDTAALRALLASSPCSAFCRHPIEAEARREPGVERLRGLLREALESAHQTGSIRDHSDPNDKTGWNVHGIETCGDPLCVDGLAALAYLRAAEARARIEKPGVERAAVVAAILFGAVDDETFDSVMAALSDSEAPR